MKVRRRCRSGELGDLEVGYAWKRIMDVAVNQGNPLISRDREESGSRENNSSSEGKGEKGTHTGCKSGDVFGRHFAASSW